LGNVGKGKERWERVRAVIPRGLCSGMEESYLRSVDELFIKNYR